MTTGLGPVYDGIGHFLLSPEDVLPAVALAVFVGLRGNEASRRALAALPVGWIAGGIAGTFIPLPTISGQAAAAISFIVLGLLVAFDRNLRPILVSGIAVLVGAAHGFFNGIAMKEAGVGTSILELIGVSITLFVIVALTASFISPIKNVVARIVVRVSGSWIAAIGLLLLGWTLRTKK